MILHKPKKCKVCKQQFMPDRDMQAVCSYECALKRVNLQQEAKRKEKRVNAHREKKKFLEQDIVHLRKIATFAFNAFIRERDVRDPCISCGFVAGSTKRQWHAGHYKPAGGYSYIRYDEANVHKQCSICNNHKSGNLVDYRVRLISKIGLDEVMRLEKPNEIKKWSADELNKITSTYRLKLRELKG